ncbi:MAG: hypothetical protein SNJ64_02630 [Endomicrobiia bacterium]
MNGLYCEVVFAIPVDRKYAYLLPKNCNEKNLVGKRVMVNFSNQKNKVGIIVSITKKISFDKDILPINKILDTEPLFKTYQLSLAEKLAKKYLVSIGEILYQMFPFENEVSFHIGIVQQNSQQQKLAIEEKINHLLSQKKHIIILQPTSIKEKFEFYKNIIFYAINENKQCIIIFPENFFLEDFYSYLTNLYPNLINKIFIYSGKKTVQERFNIWRLVHTNSINIVLSTKIGVFLPYDKNTFVVVDEPDNLGHKNLSNPPFSTTEILSEHTNYTKTFLTSFNLSVNTKFKYKKNIKLSPTKITSTNIVFVEKKYNLKNLLTKEIYKLKQCIIIFPQKGFATFIICNRCGKIVRCEKCNSVFKNDSVEKKIVCQLCNNKKNDFLCSNCGYKYYKTSGVGIQKISNYLSFSLPEAVINRLDNDLSDQEKNQIIENFNNQKIDVLVSTQEILNYIYRLNFNNVSLIYFAKMELLLFRPNYLAYENCYNFIQLLNLLTNNKSQIYLELYNKDDNYKSLLMEEKNFYLNELKIRKDLCYPPFCKIIQIIFVSKQKSMIKIFEPLISELQQINQISVFFHEETKSVQYGFKFALLIKIFENNFSLTSILDILKKYKNKEIKVYIDYDPKDFL